ncbi:hypothetical protein JKP88DRAFT_247147 [Tribonema minus]|uniref:Uncharacterized protein n=1 Tax=Tribonema minus TaxID=303371 RepID=A0A835YTT6_9STRA|nr:hypothetical protein JKP88DRAFT_247147 [Tribonema minus]
MKIQLAIVLLLPFMALAGEAPEANIQDGEVAPRKLWASEPTPCPTTKKPTQKPTTRKPTSKPTTKKPTSKPTYAPTTRKPTSKPTTHKPTSKPTYASTTRKPTSKPTTYKPTSKPTTRKPTTRKPTTRKPTTRKPTANPTTATCTNGVSCKVTVGTSEYSGLCYIPGQEPADGNLLRAGNGDCPQTAYCAQACYISNTSDGLCASSECSGGNRCRCYKKVAGQTGADCKADELVGVAPGAVIDTGGGCSENNCNALTDSSSAAACCPTSDTSCAALALEDLLD